MPSAGQEIFLDESEHSVEIFMAVVLLSFWCSTRLNRKKCLTQRGETKREGVIPTFLKEWLLESPLHINNKLHIHIRAGSKTTKSQTCSNEVYTFLSVG